MKKNKKGFTLIELLAVIVILGVLLAIAVPSVTKYINSSKQSTYVDNVKRIVDSARTETLNSKYPFPVNPNEATVIGFSSLINELEKGGKTTSYDAEYLSNNSCVIIVNTRTAEDPHYSYFVAAKDGAGYGIGTTTNKTVTAAVLNENDLKASNVVQLGKTDNNAFDCTATSMSISINGTDTQITVTSSNTSTSN